MDTSSFDELSFLHFDDVRFQYHITQSTALGRLSHVFRTAKNVPEVESPITVFSGDAFSPSLESAVTKGKHMVPVLNHLLVDVACYGNHDFDFDEDVLVNLSQLCNFPWLLVNAVHADGRLMATAKEYLVLEKKGYRIGFIGLAGTDWPSNCQHLPADCIILDPVSVAQRISESLRSTHHVDIVIAVTHMRQEEDIHLARSCAKNIDLILGGHDHELAVYGDDLEAMDDTFVGNIKLVKSGTDFRSYSDIKVWLSRKDGKASIGCIRVNQRRDITLANDLSDDNGLHCILAELHAGIANTIDAPLFHSTVPLDCRTPIVRTEETNIGNMLADAVRAYYNTDIALINSGSLRCDRVIDAGVITVKDMIDILPFDNPFVVKRLQGRTVAEALENAACDIIDGRFFQVSGIAFSIDREAPIGSRVYAVHLAPSHGCGAPMQSAPDVPLEAEREYTACMVAFIARGFDGYALFRQAPMLVDEEGAVTDSSLFLQVFRRNEHDDYGTKRGVSIDRAWAAITLGRTCCGLPLVSPSVQGRIRYIPRGAS